MFENRQIDFMGVRKIAAICSALLVLASLISLAINSLQFGLDFTSGTSIRLVYADVVVIDDVNTTLQDNGYDDAVVVSFGSAQEIRIILPVEENVAVGDQATQAAEVGETIATVLRGASNSEITLLGSDYVSEKVG
ncbi:MAG TPA: protein translocase subunit SecF, partial [Gammaproteobacteria bacterium]|nr:protein translocase subunit SecF [Gammaproteobacteria bacterium]